MLVRPGKPRPWTKDESLALLTAFHVECHNPDPKEWDRTQRDIEKHYCELFVFAREKLEARDPNFDFISSFHAEQTAQSSTLPETNTSARVEGWTKEQNLALFNGVNVKIKGGSQKSFKENSDHYYRVAGIVFRMQGDGSDKDGIRKTVDDFYNIAYLSSPCCKVSMQTFIYHDIH